MAKLRETDEALAQGNSLEDVSKSLGVSLMALHRWRTEYGSTDRDAKKRLKELERENGRLKRLVADQALDIQILKEVAFTLSSAENSKPGAPASGHPTHHKHLLHLAAPSVSCDWTTSQRTAQTMCQEHMPNTPRIAAARTLAQASEPWLAAHARLVGS